MGRFIIIFLFLLPFNLLFGQESKLAQQYYKDGEYEKAAVLYKKLYEKHNFNDYYFKYYFNSLLNLEEYEACEKAIAKAVKKKPKDTQLLVRQGALFEKQYKIKKAEGLYEKAIDKLTNNQNLIIRTANVFTELTKFDYALRVYEKGVILTGNESMFASNLADLNRRAGNMKDMVRYYLIYSQKNANSLKYVKRIFQQQFSDSLDYHIRNQLYTMIQEKPEEIIFVDLLAWVFVQNKSYDKALRQLSSLDRRMNENGIRVFELAGIAEKDKDYKTAIKAYSYIIEVKNTTSPFYSEARKNKLVCMRKELDQSGDLSEEELQKIRKGYLETLNELGSNDRSAEISIEHAEFEAYYMDRIDLAINILKELVNSRGLNERIRAKAKLDLGDYYLITGEIWEGSLLFSQVDKSYKEGFLGEMARYKNARLSYFNGDFEWSKIQLDVLKSSTSKLISNDAIDLSVFISENIGLDTTTIPLQMYANSELLAIQHKYDDAFTTLDSISFLYPEHELEDDLWYLKAKIFVDLKDYPSAEKYYLQVIEKHPDDIRGDNAMYELAELYEEKLNRIEDARALYEKLFMDYSSSTFAIEARKRYREFTREDKFMRGIKD